jgi:hypothetical protein
MIVGATYYLLAAKRGFDGCATMPLIGAAAAGCFLMPFQELVQGLWGNAYLFLMVHGALGAILFWFILHIKCRSAIMPRSAQPKAL